MKKLFCLFALILFSTTVLANTWEEQFTTTAYVNTNGYNFNVTGESNALLNAMCTANVSTSIPFGITMRRNITYACPANNTIYVNNTCPPTVNVSVNLSSCEEFARVSRLMENLTTDTHDITTSFKESTQYYPLYATCFSNLSICTKDLEALKSKESQFNGCSGEKADAIGQLNICNTDKYNLNVSYIKMKQERDDAGSRGLLWFLAGAALVGGIWYFSYNQKLRPTPAEKVGQVPGQF